MDLERLRVLLHPSRTVAARTMGAPAGLDLRALFTSPRLERDWEAASARIETLGLTPEAGMNPGDRRALYYLMRLLRPAHDLDVAVDGDRAAVRLDNAHENLDERALPCAVLATQTTDFSRT